MAGNIVEVGVKKSAVWPQASFWSSRWCLEEVLWVGCSQTKVLRFIQALSTCTEMWCTTYLLTYTHIHDLALGSLRRWSSALLWVVLDLKVHRRGETGWMLLLLLPRKLISLTEYGGMFSVVEFLMILYLSTCSWIYIGWTSVKSIPKTFSKIK